jgi:hypothetical protein
MAHYAFLDENNIVTDVITGKDENELLDGLDPETWYGNFRGQACKRTSYHTYGNQHSLDGTPFRKNYAGVGMTYDPIRDAFIPIKPYDSWTLNEETCLWEAPVPYPDSELLHFWDEATLSWIR